MCARLDSWQAGNNQAIVCLGKAMASYCNYLWKKIFDIFGRGWMLGDEGERLGLPLVLSTLNLLVDKIGTVPFKVENFV